MEDVVDLEAVVDMAAEEDEAVAEGAVAVVDLAEAAVEGVVVAEVVTKMLDRPRLLFRSDIMVGPFKTI